MKNLILVLALAFATGAVFMGCEVPPSDPGSCMTEGDFTKANVDKAYVRTICMDWTYVLVENCVEIFGLPLNPTETDIALYCDDQIDAYKTAHSGFGFELDHSCNFIDNPSFECTQYASAQSPIMSASPTERSRLTQAITAKNRLMNARKELNISLQDARFSLEEYLGQ